MRPIKFRAWDKKFKKMYEGDIRIVLAFPNDDVEIMQFTGLKDKNGKEIYEGDIVKHWYEEAFFQGTVIGVVEYDHIGAAFFIDYPDNGFARSIQSYDLAYSEFEVIGNIYENPELFNVPSEKGE